MDGVKKKEYKILPGLQHQVQYLAHPDGKKLLLLTNEKLLVVELPKGS